MFKERTIEWHTKRHTSYLLTISCWRWFFNTKNYKNSIHNFVNLESETTLSYKGYNDVIWCVCVHIDRKTINIIEIEDRERKREMRIEWSIFLIKMWMVCDEKRYWGGSYSWRNRSNLCWFGLTDSMIVRRRSCVCFFWILV